MTTKDQRPKTTGDQRPATKDPRPKTEDLSRPMIRPILRYGERSLQQPASDIATIDDNVHRLIDDMIETMYGAPGVGLAAPQIGVPLRAFVVDVSVGRNAGELVVMINPVFLEREGMQIEEEGCLSVPGFNATVVRPSRAVIRGLDRTGTEQTIEGRDLLARAFQHEMDHLDGMVFIDRLRGIKKDMIVRKIQKLKRTGRW
jgi:peptide deformylase